MRCWKCKSDMPEGLKYCGNCGVHMNRAVHMFQWLFSKKGLPVLIVILALLIGCAAWYIIPKIRIPVIEIDLDMGWYTPDERNIVYEDDNKSFGYVNNMILVFFTKDATDEQITEVINSVDGTVMGVMPGVRQYQIQVAAQTAEELEALRKQLMEFEVVKNAVIDYVTTVEGETASTPNDPWNDYPGIGYSPSWDESSPGGTNWWVEATKLLSAWGYQDSFQHINVGIVDNGYDTTHEDLEMVILNPDVANSEDHGTHVAGIMGATADNGVGITGVLKNTTLYCVDCYATDAQDAQRIPVSSLLAGIDLCIMNDCRVVNMSSGLIYDYAAGSAQGVEKTAREAITYLIMMIDAYDKDFIVVQSAGNGDNDHKAVDACRYNGWFASITPELVQTVLDEMHLDGVKLEKDITVDDVMSSLMVVAAVDISRVEGTYQLSTFSNYGETITVCAPGVDILSTVPTGNNYAYFNGTSMASPLAAAITAMVWSVDPEMSGDQVKEIVVSTASTEVLSRASADNGTYYMVDALAAVEKALQVAAEKPTEPSEPTDPSGPVQTGNPDKLMPFFDRYVGKDNYKMLNSSLITDVAGTEYYWDIGEVSSDGVAYVDSYLDLILDDTYQFELIQEKNGEYYYTYTGTGDVAPLHLHEGMSEEVENCYLWIKLVPDGDTVRFERWCSANFDFVEVLPEQNQDSAMKKVTISEYDADVLTNVFEIFYSYQGYIIEIKNTVYNADGSVSAEEIKAFLHDNQDRLIRYTDTAAVEEHQYSYDDNGRLLKETVTGMNQWETIYSYDASGEASGYCTTYSDRTETLSYDRVSENQTNVTRTTEYFSGKETEVQNLTWYYGDDGLIEKFTYDTDSSTVSVSVDRSFETFVLRTYDIIGGYNTYLDIDMNLGDYYTDTFWSLHLQSCNISCASGVIEHIREQDTNRRFIFEYTELN